MRTIPELDEFLKPIEDTIRNELIPALTGGHICSDNERKLLSLPSRYGGLGIPIFSLCAQQEYVNSRKVTAALSKFIVDQSSTCIVNEPEMKKIKATIKDEREAQYKNLSDEIQLNMSEKLKRLNDISKEKGVSNWLTAYPILEHGFDLNKQQFWDCLHIRYGWDLKNLPTTCPCGLKFDFQHSMSCKKGGFVTIRHNDLRDLTANILHQVCNDVETEPCLLPVTKENLHYRSAIRGDEARLDIRARGFWQKGQQAFMDVRVFDPNACRYLKSSLTQCYVNNEKEKKRQYNERVLEIEHGCFTPLVFSIYGGMGREGRTFYNRLADILAEKRKVKKSITTNWIRTKISFALLKTCLLCLRGSRSINRNVTNVGVDMMMSNELSTISREG